MNKHEGKHEQLHSDNDDVHILMPMFSTNKRQESEGGISPSS